MVGITIYKINLILFRNFSFPIVYMNESNLECSLIVEEGFHVAKDGYWR